jgi:hypothetical protein
MTKPASAQTFKAFIDVSDTRKGKRGAALLREFNPRRNVIIDDDKCADDRRNNSRTAPDTESCHSYPRDGINRLFDLSRNLAANRCPSRIRSGTGFRRIAHYCCDPQ